MNKWKQLNIIVRVVLVVVYAMILVHDIHPLDIDTHVKNKTESATDSRQSDHSENCDDACPCVIHVLENSSTHRHLQFTIFLPFFLTYIAPEQKHKSIILRIKDRPPQA